MNGEAYVSHWSSRLNALSKKLSAIPALLEQTPNYAANIERYETAVQQFEISRLALENFLTSEDTRRDSELRRAFFDALISSEVELDYIYHPDVDPNIGWVSLQGLTRSGITGPLAVDTQLMTVDFLSDHSGCFREFTYKPRKLSLCNTYLLNRDRPFLSAALCAADVTTLADTLLQLPVPRVECQHTPPDPQLLRQTPGIVSFRCQSILDSGVTLFKDFTFKSGIGAHLQNATTGFQLDFWAELSHPVAADVVLVLSTNFLLQTCSPDTYSVRALTGVGATTDEAWPVNSALYFAGEKTAGGLHGLRLIDGITNFVIDLRFAKPLSAISARPVYLSTAQNADPGVFQGFEFLFVLPLAQIRELDHANTIFLSIA